DRLVITLGVTLLNRRHDLVPGRAFALGQRIQPPRAGLGLPAALLVGGAALPLLHEGRQLAGGTARARLGAWRRRPEALPQLLLDDQRDVRFALGRAQEQAPAIRF